MFNVGRFFLRICHSSKYKYVSIYNERNYIYGKKLMIIKKLKIYWDTNYHINSRSEIENSNIYTEEKREELIMTNMKREF